MDGSDAAYADWLDALREAHELVEAAGAGTDDLTRAEGLRYVTRLAASALWMFVENDDPLFPTLYTNTDEHKKFGFDNPDNRYHRAALRADATYVLSGRRGAAPYVGLSFGGDLFTGDASGPQGTLAQHHLDEFGIAPGDEFELTLSPAADAGPQSIELPAATTGMIVRETFFDKSVEPASELRIERLGSVGPTAPVGVGATPEKLASAAAFLRTVSNAFIGLADYLATRPFALEGVAGRNTVQLHGDPDLYYASSWWRLDTDEAMVVTVEPAESFTYWGFQLANRWLESLDYRYLSVATNNAKAQRSDDGTWTVVVAHEDPGCANWLTTDGHSEGGMCFRWLLASEDPPLPRIDVVKLDALEAVSP